MPFPPFSSSPHLFKELLAGLDLLLPCQEDEDVARGLGDVDLQRRHHRGVQVVGLRVAGRQREAGG